MRRTFPRDIDIQFRVYHVEQDKPETIPLDHFDLFDHLERYTTQLIKKALLRI